MSNSNPVTFICTKAPAFKIRLGDNYHQFQNGRLVLEPEFAELLIAAMKRKGSTLSQWIQIVSIEDAEKLVAQHKAAIAKRTSAIQGGLTSADLQNIHRPEAIDLQTKLLASGVSEVEIQKTAQALGGSEFQVTEHVNLDALKSANVPAEPAQNPVAGFPGLKLIPTPHI